MRASAQLQSGDNSLQGAVLPTLTHLERAVRRVQDRWPGVKPEPPRKSAMHWHAKCSIAFSARTGQTFQLGE